MKAETCKHFNGIQHDVCRAGLNIRELTGGENRGWARRMPCMASNNSSVACDQYCEPTAEDLAAEEAEWDKVFKSMALVQPIISELKAKYKGQNWDGTRECPVCGNTLHLAIFAENGHVHGMCETNGCLRWME